MASIPRCFVVALILGAAPARGLKQVGRAVDIPERGENDEECPDMSAQELLSGLRNVSEHDVRTVRAQQDALKAYIKEHAGKDKSMLLGHERSVSNASAGWTKTIYFIRHAQEHCGIDGDLNHFGRELCEKQKNYDEFVDVELVYSSPMACALETAFMMFPEKRVRVSKHLMESHGVINQKSGIEVCARYDKQYTLDDYADFWKVDPAVGFREPDRDRLSTNNDLVDNLAPHSRWPKFIEMLAHRPEQKIAVITHKYMLKIAFPDYSIHRGKGLAVRMDGGGHLRVSNVQPPHWMVDEFAQDYR